MKINFFTDERMMEFWGYVKMLLQMISPGVMLVVAIAAVGMLLVIVITSWKSASKGLEKEDDDEFEVKYYDNR